VTASYARPALNTIQREDEECDGMGGRGQDGRASIDGQQGGTGLDCAQCRNVSLPWKVPV